MAFALPPIASASPETSCGTIQVYAAALPCAKPRSLAGSNGVTQLPSTLRACMYPVSGLNTFSHKDYTRKANAARQAEITQEISQIVGGAEALASATAGSE